MNTTAVAILICSADIAIGDVPFRWAEQLKPSETSEKLARPSQMVLLWVFKNLIAQSLIHTKNAWPKLMIAWISSKLKVYEKEKAIFWEVFHMREVLSGYIKGSSSSHNSGLVMNYPFWWSIERFLNDLVQILRLPPQAINRFQKISWLSPCSSSKPDRFRAMVCHPDHQQKYDRRNPLLISVWIQKSKPPNLTFIDMPFFMILEWMVKKFCIKLIHSLIPSINFIRGSPEEPVPSC